jgi:hypothetical protein
MQEEDFVNTLQAKTSRQLFEATVNLEFDYFINMLKEEMSIADFGKRVSIKDTNNHGMAFYFDNHCIFTVTPPDPEKSGHSLPLVERFYLNQPLSPTIH